MPNSKKRVVLGIVVVALVAAFAYEGYWLMRHGGTISGGTVCTEDALQCPDGSYVARSGPECKFAACPNQDSFIGMLKQDANGFWLILGAPESGGEVSYAMPLQIKVTNVLGQLVGKRVQVYGSFTEGVTLAVDRLEELPGDAGDPTLGEVGVGKSVFINGVRVTLNQIVSDSRCPADVVCIQAGWVTANVTLQSDTDKETIDLASNGGPHAFDSYQVSIESVKPSRTTTSPPQPGDYAVTFRVRSNP